MNENLESLETLKDIKRMMERSSRFISLSGLSGISAGICALLGAILANHKIFLWKTAHSYVSASGWIDPDHELLYQLFVIASVTFVAAFISAFAFTYFRSRKSGIAIWGSISARLMWNTLIPLSAGGIFLLRMLELQEYNLIAPGCLIFYGLALVNASKYTLGEVRYLGFGILLIGIINLWNFKYGLQLWALGFGVLHIIYGAAMWWKYERKKS